MNTAERKVPAFLHEEVDTVRVLQLHIHLQEVQVMETVMDLQSQAYQEFHPQFHQQMFSTLHQVCHTSVNLNSNKLTFISF